MTQSATAFASFATDEMDVVTPRERDLLIRAAYKMLDDAEQKKRSGEQVDPGVIEDKLIQMTALAGLVLDDETEQRLLRLFYAFG